MCMSFKLKLYFAEVVDLVKLANLDVGHVMCNDYTTTYAN